MTSLLACWPWVGCPRPQAHELKLDRQGRETGPRSMRYRADPRQGRQSRWSAGLWVAGPVSRPSSVSNFVCVGEGVRIPSMARSASSGSASGLEDAVSVL